MNSRRQYIGFIFVFLLAFPVPAIAQSPVTYQYVYDSAGRLVEAVDSTGIELTYAYDAAGNLLSVTRQINVLVAIFGATNANGNPINAAAPGQTITLTGIGLGNCPNVTVTVDGIPTTIVSTTTNTITIVIPPGATNGVIVVSTCHGSATITLTIGGVTVSPPMAVLTPGQTYQFTATVLPAKLSQAVTWSVEGVVGGDDVVGTISSGGLYTAPVTPGIVTVQATSVIDPELFGDAQVNVLDISHADEAFSHGVSVYVPSAPTSGGIVKQSTYIVSPGISVYLPVAPVSVGAAALPVYVLSPGVSVFLPVVPGGGGSTSLPISVLSHGVSVYFQATEAAQAVSIPIFVVSAGVSVEIDPATTTTEMLPGIRQRGPAMSNVMPSRIARGKSSVLAVTGAHLDQAKAVGVLDDTGRVDPGITVRSITVAPGGRTMILNLSVEGHAAPGRRRIIVLAP